MLLYFVLVACVFEVETVVGAVVIVSLLVLAALDPLACAPLGLPGLRKVASYRVPRLVKARFSARAVSVMVAGLFGALTYTRITANKLASESEQFRVSEVLYDLWQ